MPPAIEGDGSAASIEGGASAASIEGGGRAASIEGAGAPYGRKVRQPLKGCALTKIGSANTSIPSPFPTKNEPPIRGSSALPEFVPKTKGSRFGAMLLDEERGRHGPPAIEGLRPYEDWLRQYFYPLSIPNKKRTSHKRFVSTSGVRSENQRFPIWRNAFG